ncbi:thyroglobulin type-1 repeat-containing domain protein [Dictyocaulus viviparus]|uniref:Thyroglobulin type-1 repeat-containing domain protein n=1 Tax=Dictyocaulus viviparus TaxID=29172 RepID=A0A0D8XPP1_DICVI|nr:thyroglobulin type-1 repeat-containing domain protein [Dictyocaulus viviparus]
MTAVEADKFYLQADCDAFCLKDGVFLPRCDLEGYYRPEQCHKGYCWCVDRFGREFDNSRIKNELPDCGQYGRNSDSWQFQVNEKIGKTVLLCKMKGASDIDNGYKLFTPVILTGVGITLEEEQ